MLVRKVVAGVVLVVMGVGIWLLWPREEEPPTTTVPIAADTTTTTVPPDTTLPAATTTTVQLPRVVETVEEAEAILREFWHGWFEGIYLQDVDRIREVVITEESVEAARSQFGVMEFDASPSPEAIVLSETEILRSDDQCLVIWSAVDAQFVAGETEGVYVFRWHEGSWARLSGWRFKEDLWEQDCEAQLELPSS